MKINWKEKFGSRKFLVTLLSVVVGVITMLTNDEELVKLVAQIGGVLIPIVVYVVVEGKIDVQKLLKAGIDIADLLDNYTEDDLYIDEEPKVEEVVGEVVAEQLESVGSE